MLYILAFIQVYFYAPIIFYNWPMLILGQQFWSSAFLSLFHVKYTLAKFGLPRCGCVHAYLCTCVYSYIVKHIYSYFPTVIYFSM